MIFTESKIKGVYIIRLKPHKDQRGFFMRTFDYNIFKQKGLNVKWVQENHSLSIKRGIIRGLHFQLPPFCETKLVRCIKGKIQDVFVDLRIGSETFGKWDSIILSDNNYYSVLIPRGFAHGFCTLSDNCEVLYKVDNYYNQDYECGLLWNDPDLKINWLTDNLILSSKDKKNITFKQFVEKYKWLDV